jgi:ankyrin repeat protein
MPELTPVEQAEVDKYVNTHGREAILFFLATASENTDESLALKYIKYFVSQGANVNAKGNNVHRRSSWSRGVGDENITPFDIAMKRGESEVVKYLLSKGAKGAVYNIDDPRILFDAVDVGSLELFKIFVAKMSNGDDIIRDFLVANDMTLLGYAEDRGRTEIAEYLISKGAPRDKPVFGPPR